MHSRVLLPMKKLYDDMERVFKLGGVVGDWFWAYNGILQGDALSMIALNSTVSCILEAASAFSATGTRKRSYADDTNALTVADTREEDCEGIRGFHRVVEAYCASGGRELNLAKSFTFGDPCSKGVIGDEVQHLDDAFLEQLVEALAELFILPGVRIVEVGEGLRREARDFLVGDARVRRQRVADAEAVVAD